MRFQAVQKRSLQGGRDAKATTTTSTTRWYSERLSERTTLGWDSFGRNNEVLVGTRRTVRQRARQSLIQSGTSPYLGAHGWPPLGHTQGRFGLSAKKRGG